MVAFLCLLVAGLSGLIFKHHELPTFDDPTEVLWINPLSPEFFEISCIKEGSGKLKGGKGLNR